VPIGHRRVADDPVADVVDVAPGRQVHHGVGAPSGGPDHLLDLLRHRRGHCRIADIGVDLDEEIPPDRHRFCFRMVDVGRDDRSALRHLVPDEFGRDEIRDIRPEALAVALERRFGVLPPEIFSDGHILHLRRDDAGSGISDLRDRPPSGRTARLVTHREFRRQPAAFGKAVVLGPDVPTLILFGVPARGDPAFPQTRQPCLDRDRGLRIGIGTGTVIDCDRPFAGRGVKIDFAHRHPDIGVPRAGLPHAPGRGQRSGRDLW